MLSFYCYISITSISTTTVTCAPTITQIHQLHTAYVTAAAFQPYAVCAHLNLPTSSNIQPALIMDIRQSLMIDSTGHYKHAASCIMCPRILHEQSLPTIHKCQSPVIDKTTTDFCQESTVAGTRVMSHVTSKTAMDVADSLSDCFSFQVNINAALFNCNKKA